MKLMLDIPDDLINVKDVDKETLLSIEDQDTNDLIVSINRIFKEELNRKYEKLNLQLPGLDNSDDQDNQGQQGQVVPIGAVNITPITNESNVSNETDYTNYPVVIKDADGKEVTLPSFVMKVDGKMWYLKHTCGHIEDREIKKKKSVYEMIGSARKFAVRKCSQCRTAEDNALDLRDGYALINTDNLKQACWASENRREILNRKLPLAIESAKEELNKKIESGEIEDVEKATSDLEETINVVVSGIKNEKDPEVFIRKYNSNKGYLGDIIEYYENKNQA